jgi:hypothetical protein
MRKRGFSISDLFAILVLATIMMSLGAVFASESRRSSTLGHAIMNLRFFGHATGEYQADNDELFWGFTWRAGDALSQWPELNDADSDLQAHANQAVDILRRHGLGDMPKVSGWLADLMYSHLVLEDYLGEGLMRDWAVDPADEVRQCWRDHPLDFTSACPSYPDGADGPSGMRWPYSSSYQLQPAFWDQSIVGSRVSQGQHHTSYVIPGSTQLGVWRGTDVTFPSQKVHMADSHARHFGPTTPYFAYREARMPLLFVDGSVSVRVTKDANRGWKPNDPSSSNGTSFWYSPHQPPNDWEAPTLSGTAGDMVFGYYRWTRGGIKGRDFGGPEIDTGQ